MNPPRQRHAPRAAALYCRISQDRGGEALGVQRQEELCRDLARQLGWNIAEVYVDNDLSAYSGKPRPEYERMLRDLEAGARDGVIVVDQDRLTRHPAELEDFITLADRHGIALANVSGDIDLSTSDGRFKARIMGAVARQESEKKSERLKRQRAQAARLGKRQGGRRPYGYERDGVTVRPDEAARIREAATRLLAGESLRTVARDWNARGIPTSSGGRWGVTNLVSMLTGPRITGLRVHHGEVVADAEWPPIIDRATWEQLRAVLGDPRRRRSGRPPLNLLTGMLRCGLCGCTLSSSRRPDKTRRYICSPTPATDACGRIGVQAEPLENEIRDRVLTRLAGPALSATLAAGVEAPDGLAEQLERDEAKLKQLARQFAEDQITYAEWLEARTALEDRIRNARDALTHGTSLRVLTDLPETPEALRAEWDGPDRDLDWRRALVAAVVDHVVVNPHNRIKTRRRFDPDRVTIIWRA